MLTGLWEQLDAAHAKAFTATRHRILAKNRTALAEVACDRDKAEAAQ